MVLAASGCGRVAFDDIPDAREPRRSTLRLDRVAPAEPLVGFVLPIVLDASRADLSELTPATLRAFSAGVELDLEVEDAGPPLVAWARVPRIEGLATEITIEYGGVERTTGSPWSADYLGVYHMKDGATVLDSGPSGDGTGSPPRPHRQQACSVRQPRSRTTTRRA